MQERNQIEKIDMISNKIKHLNTYLIAIIKNQGSIINSTDKNLINEQQKSLANWKKQFRTMKESIEKMMKDYLPHGRDQLRLRNCKECPFIVECKGQYRQINSGQAVQLQFAKQETGTKEVYYEILVNLYTIDKFNNTSIQIIHKLLKPMVRQFIIQNIKSAANNSITKQLISKSIRQYFDYWREVNRGKQQCPKCRKVFKYHEEYGFVPPTIHVKRLDGGAREYYHHGCYDK